MKKYFIIVPLALALLFVVLKLSIYTESLSERTERERLLQFNPTERVAYAWEHHLESLEAEALPLDSFMRGYQSDPQVLAKQSGKVLGIGSNYFFVVKGQAADLRVKDDFLWMTPLCEDDQMILTQICVPVKYIFGNLARDASGWFNIDDFKNTITFNEVSSCMNQYIKENVVAGIEEKIVGHDTCRYCVAVEVDKDLKGAQKLPTILEVIPYIIDFE